MIWLFGAWDLLASGVRVSHIITQQTIPVSYSDRCADIREWLLSSPESAWKSILDWYLTWQPDHVDLFVAFWIKSWMLAQPTAQIRTHGCKLKKVPAHAPPIKSRQARCAHATARQTIGLCNMVDGLHASALFCWEGILLVGVFVPYVQSQALFLEEWATNTNKTMLRCSNWIK